MDRYFPVGRPRRETRRGVRATAMVGLILAVAAGVLSPAFADREDDLEDRVDHVDGQVVDARGSLEHSSKRLQSATADLRASRSRLHDARAELADTLGELTAARALDEQMQRALAAAEQRLAEAEAELASASDDVARAETEVERFAVQGYATTDPGLMSVDAILDGDGAMQYPRLVSAAESVVSVQTAQMDGLDAARILLQLREERVQVLRDDVAARRREAAEQLDRSRDLAQQARAVRERIRGLVDDLAAVRDRAQSARRHDLRILDQMERERERVRVMLQDLRRQQELRELRRQRALRLQQQEQRAQPAAPAPTTTAPAPTDSGGYLDYPVAGAPITSPYGMRMHPVLHVYKLHDGTDFGVACGTPVHAAAAGQVVGAYFNAGYGNRVILSHGAANGVSLATSYNHLTSFAVSDGEQVARGEVIGLSGTTGYSTGCHLHFMVYENGATVDPVGWL